MNNHTHQTQFHSSVVRYAPLIWLAGLSSVAYQLAALWSAIRSGGKIVRPNAMQIVVYSYCAVYAISIGIAAIEGADILRVLAALYNLSIWVSGAILLGTAGLTHHDSVRRSARMTLVVLFVLAVGSYFVFGSQGSVRLNSLLGFAINADALPENLAANTNLHMTSVDWSTLGLGSRVSVLAPYPTASGMLAVVLLALSAPASLTRSSALRYCIYIALAIVVCMLCASRAAVASAFLYCALLGLFYVARVSKSQSFKAAIVCLIIISVLLASSLLSEAISALWSTVNSSRSDSSSLRFMLYTRSVSSAWAEHPLLGFGIKERVSELAIPLGSHSTFFGAMYKTGLIGGLVVTLFFLLVTKTSFAAGFRSRCDYRSSLAAGCIAMLPLLIFEDLDSVPLVAYTFFLMIALVSRRSAIEQR